MMRRTELRKDFGFLGAINGEEDPLVLAAVELAHLSNEELDEHILANKQLEVIQQVSELGIDEIDVSEVGIVALRSRSQIAYDRHRTLKFVVGELIGRQVYGSDLLFDEPPEATISVPIFEN